MILPSIPSNIPDPGKISTNFSKWCRTDFRKYLYVHSQMTNKQKIIRFFLVDPMNSSMF